VGSAAFAGAAFIVGIVVGWLVRRRGRAEERAIEAVDRGKATPHARVDGSPDAFRMGDGEERAPATPSPGRRERETTVLVCDVGSTAGDEAVPASSGSARDLGATRAAHRRRSSSPAATVPSPTRVVECVLIPSCTCAPSRSSWHPRRSGCEVRIPKLPPIWFRRASAERR